MYSSGKIDKTLRQASRRFESNLFLIDQRYVVTHVLDGYHHRFRLRQREGKECGGYGQPRTSSRELAPSAALKQSLLSLANLTARFN